MAFRTIWPICSSPPRHSTVGRPGGSPHGPAQTGGDAGHDLGGPPLPAASHPTGLAPPPRVRRPSCTYGPGQQGGRRGAIAALSLVLVATCCISLAPMFRNGILQARFPLAMVNASLNRCREQTELLLDHHVATPAAAIVTLQTASARHSRALQRKRGIIPRN